MVGRRGLYYKDEDCNLEDLPPLYHEVDCFYGKRRSFSKSEDGGIYILKAVFVNPIFSSCFQNKMSDKQPLSPSTYFTSITFYFCYND